MLGGFILQNRKPTKIELALILKLIKYSQKLNLVKEINKIITVEPMKDGGMGSLFLYPEGVCNYERKFGRALPGFQYKDSDGVDVIATLYLDEDGELLELDMWKTNYSPLIQISLEGKFLNENNKI
jgi:hypothetical protein